MKISSIQIGWILAVAVVLGFFLPWVRWAPVNMFDDSEEIIEQLADDKSAVLYDYVLMNGQDWHALWKNPASGESGYQMALADHEPGRELLKILFGAEAYWLKGKLLLLAPLMAILGALALMYRKNQRNLVVTLMIAEMGFYLLIRRQLHEGILDRLMLELNWGIWLALYGLALMALLQAVCLLLPPKVKW